MELFGFYFSYLDIALFAVLVIALFVQLYYYIRYFMGIIRHNKKIEKNKVIFSETQEPVSVIICARDEVENLQKFLPFVLEQKHPEYEVIVVNDGSTDDTTDFLSLMTKKYAHLRTTFVPNGATNISTKKLGLTLGIKAAKYDLLVFTDADCMPEGENWLSTIVRNFSPEKEFVLGYGGYLRKKGFLNRLIKFDTLFIAIQYLGMAAAKRPYMGVGRNLAYRKETFFNMKGFASSLNLISGDDDLLVNSAAKSGNTAIETSSESVTWSEPKTTFRNWYYQKERHISVSNYYNSKSKLRLAVEPISRAFFYAACIALVVFGLLSLNWILLGSTVFLFLLRYGLQIYVINKSASILGERKFYLTIPFFDTILPLISSFILVFGKKNHRVKWK